MTFEGLQDNEFVNNYYAGGSGSLGSTGGQNLGVQWTDALAGFAPNGIYSNTANEPTPPTVIGFTSTAAVMNVANGFSKGFSFYYAAANTPGTVTVWSGLNGTGNILATLPLAVNGSNPNFTQAYSNWSPIGVMFAGTAESVTFGGTANYIVFDNVTINSINPGGTGSTINTSQPYFLASQVGSSVMPVFQGGTLRMDQANATYNENFSLDGSTTNTIDQYGNNSTFTGYFYDAMQGTPGNITFANSGQGGSVTLTGANTYTGTTTIKSGAELIIGYGGSINNQSTLTNAGVFMVQAGGTATFGGVTNSGLISNFGTITDVLNNSGTVSNNGTYNADANNTGTITNAGTWNGSLLSNTGTVTNGGTWNAATFANNTGGTVNTTGTLAATTSITNAGTFNAQGSITTPVFNNTGTVNQTGALGGTITTFNNAGTLSLVNGVAGDVFRATNFVGQGGKLAIDVNAATQTSDLVATTNVSGSTSVFVSPVGGNAFITNPIKFLSSTTPSTATFTDINTGPIVYSITTPDQQNYYLVSAVNPGVAAAAPTNIASLLTALNSGFFQNASPIVSDPPNPTANEINGGPWIRVAEGENNVRATTTAFNPSGPSSGASDVHTQFSGFQTGWDLGVANVQGSGWNTHFGVTAGQVELGTSDRDNVGVSSSGKIPYAGLYTAVSGHGFFADATIREDFYNINITNPAGFLTAVPDSGTAFTANLSAGYKYDLGHNWFVEPAAAFTYSNLHVDSLLQPLDSTKTSFGTLNFLPIASELGRIGGRLGTNVKLEKMNLALQPFVTASVWHEFAGDTVTDFVTNATVPLTVSRVGTFGQIGVGTAVQVLQTGLIGYVRGDYRFGEYLDGYALSAGLRYEFY